MSTDMRHEHRHRGMSTDMEACTDMRHEHRHGGMSTYVKA